MPDPPFSANICESWLSSFCRLSFSVRSLPCVRGDCADAESVSSVDAKLSSIVPIKSSNCAHDPQALVSAHLLLTPPRRTARLALLRAQNSERTCLTRLLVLVGVPSV